MPRLLMIFAMVSFSLSGCMSTQINTGCPPLVQYSAETQRKAADEIEKLPDDSAVARMISDYKKTRDACRITK